MPSRNYATFALHRDLISQIDDYLRVNKMAYRSRAEVITAAVRAFLEAKMPVPMPSGGSATSETTK